MGEGRPVVVVHGGPDFDHQYLLPEMDRLAQACRLVYYDQRGRGRSFAGEADADVTILGETEDLDGIRRSLDLDTVALLGHSWGALVAMEYALRFPARVSHLVLMNTAPASPDDAETLRRSLATGRSSEQSATMAALVSDPAYRRGDIDADAAYYSIHFSSALARPELLDDLIRRLRRGFTEEGIVAARAIEQRLYEETWRSDGYDLLARLRRLRVPTLLIHGDGDLIPVELARHIAEAIPGARLDVLSRCGHFAYLEQPERTHRAITSSSPWRADHITDTASERRDGGGARRVRVARPTAPSLGRTVSSRVPDDRGRARVRLLGVTEGQSISNCTEARSARSGGTIPLAISTWRGESRYVT